MDTKHFAKVRNWIFDLDNTLYPENTKLFIQISDKIKTYVSDLINISQAEAQKLQTEYYWKYGTTLRGLMVEHNVEPNEFLEFVHDIDHSVISPDLDLISMIQKLPGRRFIMTNGSKKHAENVAQALGIADHFDDMFGIAEANMLPKPHRKTYKLFLEKYNINAEKSCMFEDLVQNLSVPHELGMLTILIIPKGTGEILRKNWEIEGREGHVDFVSDNLGDFLTDIVKKNF